MSRIQKERDRLLATTARTVGLTATATTLLTLSVPGTIPLPLYFASLVLLACTGVAQFPLTARVVVDAVDGGVNDVGLAAVLDRHARRGRWIVRLRSCLDEPR